MTNGKEESRYMDELYCQRASCNSSYRLYRRGERFVGIMPCALLQI